MPLPLFVTLEHAIPACSIVGVQRMPLGDKEILEGSASYSVAPAQRVPRTRVKVRPQPIDWRAMAKQVEIAKRMDRLGIKQPSKHRKASVGSYTRKDAGRCHVVKR